MFKGRFDGCPGQNNPLRQQSTASLWSNSTRALREHTFVFSIFSKYKKVVDIYWLFSHFGAIKILRTIQHFTSWVFPWEAFILCIELSLRIFLCFQSLLGYIINLKSLFGLLKIRNKVEYDENILGGTPSALLTNMINIKVNDCSTKHPWCVYQKKGTKT